MTHPSRNFLSSLCSVFMHVCMAKKTGGFESSVNKVFQKEKLVNSKTIKDLQSSKRKVFQQELNWFRVHTAKHCCKNASDDDSSYTCLDSMGTSQK
jgi:hypothetical protein